MKTHGFPFFFCIPPTLAANMARIEELIFPSKTPLLTVFPVWYHTVSPLLRWNLQRVSWISPFSKPLIQFPCKLYLSWIHFSHLHPHPTPSSHYQNGTVTEASLPLLLPPNHLLPTEQQADLLKWVSEQAIFLLKKTFCPFRVRS